MLGPRKIQFQPLWEIELSDIEKRLQPGIVIPFAFRTCAFCKEPTVCVICGNLQGDDPLTQSVFADHDAEEFAAEFREKFECNCVLSACESHRDGPKGTN